MVSSSTHQHTFALLSLVGFFIDIYYYYFFLLQIGYVFTANRICFILYIIYYFILPFESLESVRIYNAIECYCLLCIYLMKRYRKNSNIMKYYCKLKQQFFFIKMQFIPVMQRIFSIIISVFSVIWSLRNQSNMLNWSNISLYYWWKQLCCLIFLCEPYICHFSSIYLKYKHFWNIIHVFTDFFGQFNISLLNKKNVLIPNFWTVVWSPADFVCLPTDKEIISL